MSRTDKDAPYWVQVRDLANGRVEHDHREGRCVISDDRRQRWGAFQHHRWRNCKHRVDVYFECTKAEPYVNPRRGGWPDARRCWTSVCGCPVPELWKTEDVHAWGRCENRRRVGCVGHHRVEWDYSIPCECDDDEVPTCFPDAGTAGGFNHYTRGGVPSRFVRSYYHKPERGREREVLGQLRQRANAGDDLEDWDFENRQARNSCRWMYW